MRMMSAFLGHRYIFSGLTRARFASDEDFLKTGRLVGYPEAIKPSFECDTKSVPTSC